MTPLPINPIKAAYDYNNLPEILWQLQNTLREPEIEIEEPEYDNQELDGD